MKLVELRSSQSKLTPLHRIQKTLRIKNQNQKQKLRGKRRPSCDSKQTQNFKSSWNCLISNQMLFYHLLKRRWKERKVARRPKKSRTRMAPQQRTTHHTILTSNTILTRSPRWHLWYSPSSMSGKSERSEIRTKPRRMAPLRPRKMIRRKRAS